MILNHILDDVHVSSLFPHGDWIGLDFHGDDELCLPKVQKRVASLSVLLWKLVIRHQNQLDSIYMSIWGFP